MIQLNEIKMIIALKEKTILTANDYNMLRKDISNYFYPLGLVPYESISQNNLYENDSLTNNLNYLTTFLNGVFSDVYTEEELNIIKGFFILHVYSYFILSSEIMAYLYPFLYMSADKTEIQYCIDEIKYRYLMSLIYSNSNEHELIQRLTTELEAIEASHNAVKLRQRK